MCSSLRECFEKLLAEGCSPSRLVIAVAYVKESGVEELANILGGRLGGLGLEVVAGLDFYLTEPGALRRLLSMGASVWVYTGEGEFHPKVYVADCGGSKALIVGSSNLSRGAVAGGNIEYNVLLLDDGAAGEALKFIEGVKASCTDAKEILGEYERRYREVEEMYRQYRAYAEEHRIKRPGPARPSPEGAWHPAQAPAPQPAAEGPSTPAAPKEAHKAAEQAGEPSEGLEAIAAAEQPPPGAGASPQGAAEPTAKSPIDRELISRELACLKDALIEQLIKQKIREKIKQKKHKLKKELRDKGYSEEKIEEEIKEKIKKYAEELVRKKDKVINEGELNVVKNLNKVVKSLAEFLYELIQSGKRRTYFDKIPKYWRRSLAIYLDFLIRKRLINARYIGPPREKMGSKCRKVESPKDPWHSDPYKSGAIKIWLISITPRRLRMKRVGCWARYIEIDFGPLIARLYSAAQSK